MSTRMARLALGLAFTALLPVALVAVQPAGAAVNPRSSSATGGLERGIDVDWIGQQDVPLATLTAQAQSVMQYVKSLGSNSVTISFAYDTPNRTSDVVRAEAITPSVQQVELAVKAAHRYGLAVTIRPFLDQVPLKAVASSLWSGAVSPTNRSAWFAHLYAFLAPYLVMSQKTGVQTFVVGSELNALASAPNWRPLLAQAGRLYHGKLSYAANWDVYETSDIGVPVHTAGLDAYPPQDVGWNASLKKLTNGWLQWFEKSPTSLHKKTVIYEVAILATDGAYKLPWAWTLAGKYNPEVQYRWFMAACLAARDAGIAGINFWGITSNQVLTGSPGSTDRGSFAGRAGATAIKTCFTQVY